MKIVEKEDKLLQDLYNKRRILRTKTDEESLKQLDELETELSNKHSEVNSNKTRRGRPVDNRPSTD